MHGFPTGSPRVGLARPLWGPCTGLAPVVGPQELRGLAEGYQSVASPSGSSTGAKQEHAHLSAPRPLRADQSGAGAEPGRSRNREERRGEAGASAASFLQTRPRRPQPRPRRRRRRRPRGMACLMAAFSVGTAMVSRTSFALGAGFYLLGKLETQSPAPWSSHPPPRSASSRR